MTHSTSSSSVASINTGRILVSDDDLATRESLVTMLSRAGFKCKSSDSSTAALEMMAGEDFDLIIADIHMDGNADLEMVRTLNERKNSPPIILITGQPSLDTAMKAVRLRVFDYLVKPVDGDKLVAHAREGVAIGRMMTILTSQRNRLKESLAEIDRCEELSRNGSGTVLNSALSTYLGVAVQQSLATIKEFGELAESVISNDGPSQEKDRFQNARPLVLVNALQETIRVLEQTKTSFKSRELADLRRKLEKLME
jgi:DNA-binding response OmpR family regulator